MKHNVRSHAQLVVMALAILFLFAGCSSLPTGSTAIKITEVVKGSPGTVGVHYKKRVTISPGTISWEEEYTLIFINGKSSFEKKLVEKYKEDNNTDEHPTDDEFQTWLNSKQGKTYLINLLTGSVTEEEDDDSDENEE